jgi:protein O-GlcNAc transferase
MFNWQKALRAAAVHAQLARFDAFLAECQQIVDTCGGDVDAVLSVASLLSSFGFLAAAQKCFRHARSLAPNNVRPLMGLADTARDTGNHGECRALYDMLLKLLPEHEIIRRSALLSLEYDPSAGNDDRLRMAKDWGQWATEKAGRTHERPPLRPLEGRPLRVGYVSADFCQHTVGLFVKDIIGNHDPDKIMAFAYSAGKVNDWVTSTVRTTCGFRDVSSLDDRALVALIRQDEIDVLVDLSGQTAGSRLTVFAHRPAPVQVSWLGYFATTGLPAVDVVLLDEWHAPPGTEEQFVEEIIRLPGGRFCYTPVPFAPPDVALPPSLSNGCITFGCFNNTAKLNAAVYDVWARILSAVPKSHLILKWRTFHDAGMCQLIRDAFAQRGIAPERIELRGASFHKDLLKEYDDIDIALDPFPFTGGLTSCEALWMGVPVVTWPQSRVVSRQTLAFLSATSLPELAARDADDYVLIACELAGNRQRLANLRAGMRQKMQVSSLMDVQGFTQRLEQSLTNLYQEVFTREMTQGQSNLPPE